MQEYAGFNTIMNTIRPILTRLRISLSIGWVLPIALMMASGGPLGAAHEPDGKPPEVIEKTAPGGELTQKMTVPDYVSPLQSYKKYVESSEPDWKAANGLVGEIGGWRAYAKEAFLEARQERDAQEKAMEQETLDAEKKKVDGEEPEEKAIKPEGDSE